MFDTNAYSAIPAGAIEALKDAERRCGVVACASAIVALELLAHLADTNDPAFGRCLISLRNMRAHVRLWDGRELLPIFGTARDALSREWFGVADPMLRSLTPDLALAIEQATDAGGDANESLRNYCAQARELIADGEARFGDTVKQLVDEVRTEALSSGTVRSERELASAHGRFHREHGLQYAAETIALAIAARVNRRLDGEALKRCSAGVLEVMPVAAAFLRNELGRYFAGGADPTLPENRNSTWDLEHCGHAARKLIPVDRKLLGASTPLLVTDDRRIRVAAKDVGCEHLVMSLADYRKAIDDGDFSRSG